MDIYPDLCKEEMIMNCKEETERICKFIKDTVKEAGAKGVVLGVSGGLDSAVVAMLVNKVFPWRRSNRPAEYIYMPMSYEIHNPEVYNLCYNILKVSHTTLPIDRELVNSIAQPRLESPIPKGNIIARLRMIKLYWIANGINFLVIGTTNKSEHMIGYFTKYGDGACDFEPIQHLYKTEVYELAKYLGVPNGILKAKPTAGLWEGQTDEGEIGMSYEKLDKILRFIKVHSRWLQEHYGDIVFKIDKYPYLCDWGLAIGEVDKVKEMIRKSEHKRRLPRCLK